MPTITWLIAGRVVQGIGAAALSPASLALLAAAYPVPQERVKAIGLWAGFSGIGLAAGPVAGGILVEAFGWPAIFLVNAPIGAVLLLAGLRVLGESRNPAAPAIDIPGTVLSVLGVGGLANGLIEGGSRGWTSRAILGCFGGFRADGLGLLLPVLRLRPGQGGLASGVSSTTGQIGAVLGVAVLGAVVRARASGGASFEAGLGTAFVVAGAVTLVSAVFTACGW